VIARAFVSIGCSFASNRQEPYPVSIQVHGHQRAFFEVRQARVKCPNHHIADRHREDILRPNLNDAQLPGLPARQERTEIQIMGEDHESVRAGLIHDLDVRCGRESNLRPMNAIETRIG
jgi:hypothetical protein